MKEKNRPGAGLPALLASPIWAVNTIVMLAIGLLGFFDNAVRKHPKRQILRLARLIRIYGFLVPVLLDSDNKIIAGEARVLAAKFLGMTHVPAIYVRHLTEPEARALRIADNRMSELSVWDTDALAAELQSLIDHRIEIKSTGFEVAEADMVIRSRLAKPKEAALDDCPPLREPSVSRKGDIWLCGSHRIACGDVREQSLMAKLMGTAIAAQLFTDPPYNVPIQGHVMGSGKIKHDEFEMASGEMSPAEFAQFLFAFLTNVAAYCKDGALLYAFMDWRSVHALIEAGLKAGLRYFNLCVWAKTNAGMGGYYRSQHELVVVFKKGDAPHCNNIEMGKFGRNRSNLWTYEGANSINPERRKELRMHPTVKPAQLCADAILDCTKPGDIVLDPFLGSGTTLIAAEDTDRTCFGLEIHAAYVDVAVRRWQEFTAADAVLEATGETFAEVEKRRNANQPAASQ